MASGLARAERDGTIKKNYQFIEGFLVRVEPNNEKFQSRACS